MVDVLRLAKDSALVSAVRTVQRYRLTVEPMGPDIWAVQEWTYKGLDEDQADRLFKHSKTYLGASPFVSNTYQGAIDMFLKVLKGETLAP